MKILTELFDANYPELLTFLTDNNFDHKSNINDSDDEINIYLLIDMDNRTTSTNITDLQLAADVFLDVHDFLAMYDGCMS